MKIYNIKDYIESINIKKDKTKFTNKKYEKLSIFFNSITSLLLEENLSIILLNDELEIINIFSNDNYDYGYLYGGIMDLNLPSPKSNLSILLSPLFSQDLEGISYKFLLLGESIEIERFEIIYRKLNIGLNNLYDYDRKEHSDYHNLLCYLDSVDEGISACDEQGHITYINKSAANMLDTTPDEFLNEHLSNLYSHSILAKVIENKSSYIDIEYFLKYKDKTLHLINSAYPVLNKNKELTGAVDIYKKIKRSIKLAADLGGYGASYTFDDFIGNSKALSDAINISKKFADSNRSILIIGDSGTGKELFAQSIHNYSIRRDGPFVAINCASYPKDLFESELFGYEEGAFTGAKRGGKSGKFELADGGTLFLDEVGELPLNLQAKLLRVIETKRISRIGSNKKVDIDVRIISATNRNLEQMIQNNSFREDLYYRLKVLYLQLEPLKNRENDVILLCDHFIHKFSKDSFKNIIGLDKDAIEYVKSYDWPGNIRELENIISLALFYCGSEYITKDDLVKSGLKLSNTRVDSYGDKDLSTITNDIILKTLKKNKGNKKRTAEELGISRNTIYRLLK